MKHNITLRKVIVTVLMVVGLMVEMEMNVEAQMLPCQSGIVQSSGLGSVFGPVCGCDGNSHFSEADAVNSGVTHFTTDTCGITPTYHADFSYAYNGLDFYFLDSSVSTGTQTYGWDFGDGGVQNGINASHTYASLGLYLVSLTLYDTNVGSYSITSRIIYADPSAVSSDFMYVYITTVSPNCVNNGNVTANIYGGNSPFTYLWSDGQTTETAVGLGTGNYAVTVTDFAGLTTTANQNLISACDNIIKGTVFKDINGNCFFDGGENPLSYIYVRATNGNQNYYSNVDANGNYSINIPTAGTYTINAYSWSNGYGTCGDFTICSGITVAFPLVGDTSTGNNIGFAVSTEHDLGIFATWSGANPGFQMHYNLYPYDFSVPSFVGLVFISFHYDANLVFDSTNNPQMVHDGVAHTLTRVGAVMPNSFFGAPPIICYFHVPVTLSPNYVVESDFYINPVTNDCDTSNNHLHTSGIVTGSFDPNEKTVSPAGNILNTDSVLTYTIHFQNTGNDTTHFVIVTDTLPSSLDPTTVVNLASSAPFSEFSISGTGILKWVFNPLFLPDSASNEPASKGFVMFKVKVKPNLPFGTTISNKASIFFDYNPAVITNYATNSIVNGIEQLIAGNEQLAVYPNPTENQLTVYSNRQAMKNITVTDVLGREIINQQTNSQTAIINCQLIAKGIYFLKVQMQNGDVVVERFVKE